MSPKIKMSDIYDGDDKIELTDEELKEMMEDADFDAGADDETVPIPEYHFSNPNPYFKVKPRPEDAPKRDISFDEKGNIVVKIRPPFGFPKSPLRKKSAARSSR